MYALGGLIAFAFFALLGLLIFKAVPETNKDLLTTAMGVLFGAFTGVVGYFFGSSLGSARKTELMTGGQNDGETKV